MILNTRMVPVAEEITDELADFVDDMPQEIWWVSHSRDEYVRCGKIMHEAGLSMEATKNIPIV